MDYATPTFRKTKRDKKAKARYKIYKKGGKYRSAQIGKSCSECQSNQ